MIYRFESSYEIKVNTFLSLAISFQFVRDITENILSPFNWIIVTSCNYNVVQHE